MRKSIISIIAGCALAFGVSSASMEAYSFHIDPAKYHAGGDDYEAEDDSPYHPAIVDAEDEELAKLVERGAVLLRRREHLALMYLPHSLLFPENDSQGKKSPRLLKGEDESVAPQISVGRTVSPAMDFAKERFGASRIHSGEGLPKAFTGKGVVVGICDIGFDPLHANFIDPITGESRVKRIVQYKEAQGQRIEMDSMEEYSEWITDSAEQYHATHVAGILAGSYNANGYSGTAPGADIVVTTSQLSDVGLLAGVEDIIEYAQSVGKPAVINLSMGNYTGPHDGTSLFSQYMDMLGREAIICLSAGNTGERANSVSVTFDNETKSIGQRLHNYQWTQFDIQGMTDIWSADRQTFTVTPAVYDETTKEIIYRFPTLTLADGEMWGITTGEASPGLEAADETFSSLYSGWMQAGAEVSPYNGRYNFSLFYDLHTDHLSSAGAWARYNIAIIVEGGPGQHVDIFADGSTTRLREVPGSKSPDSSFSVSDLATGHNVLCIGMYNSRMSWPLVDGTTQSGSVQAGTVNSHSSYGTLLDGRVLPHTVAPGNPIVSSFSGPYLESHPEEISSCATIAEIDGKKHYWGVEGGTSMSSPYVAGFLATMLEADPSLTIDDIRKLLKSTNRRDVPDPSDPRNGDGWFNPYTMITEVVRNSGVPGTISPILKAYISDSHLNLLNPTESESRIMISDTEGRVLQTHNTSASETSLDLTPWRGRILIIHVSSPTSAPQILKAVVL